MFRSAVKQPCERIDANFRSWLAVIMLLLLPAPPLAADGRPELLNQEERQWLESLREPLIVGSEANYRPYAYVDEEGQLNGIAGDYLRLVEERLGIRFAIHEYPSFAETLQAARQRHIDIVPFAIAAQERRSYLNFTQPVFEVRDRIMTRVESTATLKLDDLAGMRVGLIDGYALQADITANRPEIVLVPFPNELDAVRALSLGMLDALIVDIGVASYHIQREGITNLRVAGEVGIVGYQTFGTRNDWPILNSIIGKSLASISAEEREEIARRWINIGGVDPRQFERLWKQVGVAVGAAFLAIAAILFWSFSLRRIVAIRTLDLERELAERRRVEAAKERLAVAVERSAEYVIVIDTSATVEYANLSFLEASGSSDLHGRPFESLVPDHARETLLDAVRGVRESGVWRGRVDLLRGHETPMTVNMTIAPIYNEKAEIDGYVATGRDITHEEQLEARLRQGEKLSALGTLAGGIAHDFNNLLVPILGYVDMIRKESTPAASAYLDAVADAGERARDLVQRILIFGRGRKAVMVPLDLRSEVADAISFLESLLPATIDVQADLGDCSAVLADRTQIQQILLNLCTNASDAMAENGGVLKVKLEQRVVVGDAGAPLPDLAPGDYAVLTISDTGMGMDEETRARIFDPYFTEKRQSKGTGLGLAIVHSVVTDHGASIHVDSTPGTGTSIQIYFPTVAEKPAKRRANSSADIPRGDDEQIMLVDDDELVLNVAERMIQGLGYKVSAWSDPADALNAFAEAPNDYAAILSDFTMPGLSGVEFAERAQAIRPGISVAIMTGNTAVLDDYNIRHISKPIQVDELARCLRDCID